VGNVGDSRAILVRDTQNGTELISLSEDHKPDRQSEAARVSKAGGFVSSESHNTFRGLQTCHRINGKIAVSRAWGDFDFKQQRHLPAEAQLISCEPDVEVEERRPGDVIIFACDGIWDVMSSQEAAEFYLDTQESVGTDLGEIGEQFIER